MCAIMFKTCKFILVLAALTGCCVHALENGLARTPPMGWLAWVRFTCDVDCARSPEECINESLFKSMAKHLVTDGYRALGYEYVNIDDCWSEKHRSAANGERLEADKARFPHGIKPLAEYIHSLDLKLGLYGDCGTATCAGYPAQLKYADKLEDNYYELDSKTLVDWHVDSFKLDGCYIEPLKAQQICPKFSDVLLKTTKQAHNNTKPIYLMCEWPFYINRHHAPKASTSGLVDYQLVQDKCNAWRYYEDVEDSWQSVLNVIDFSTNIQDTILNFHKPGAWFDPDQLVIGNFGLSVSQARAQMAIWCAWSAPLYMSNDLRKLDPQMAAILKNERLIEVDQDPFGLWALVMKKVWDIQAFVKPVMPMRHNCTSFVVVYLNRESLGNGKFVTMKLKDLLLPTLEKTRDQIRERANELKVPFDYDGCLERLQRGLSSANALKYRVEDLYDDTLIDGVVTKELTLHVNPSDVRVVKLTEIE